ncbi:FG-GAP-like repeat-containing protein [Nannocystis pusilla]|uniref:FG-GAP-like repeat-containing protein n=1 Tax=Nannocystis pusilla TaxID=889268 RepID=A0A9X3J441_9BACT|nr:FG-GAP-like repeat-containing protein [Nannocystis pusilla]MCY1013915.1 FG-GAP-like repeat-containing protein [Nannocystis pusilla]
MNRHTIPFAAALALLLSTSPASAYELVPDALDPQACNGQGCWTNHLRVTDLDGDGDLDILLANYADFFAGADKPQPLVVYLNNGMADFSNESAAAVGDYVGNVRQVAVGDVDGDGDPDLYAPDGAGGPHVLFINDGMGVFTDEAATRLPAGSFPQGAAARMGDVDGDGDLDILAGDGYSQGGGAAQFARLYRNDGAGVFEEVRARSRISSRARTSTTSTSSTSTATSTSTCSSIPTPTAAATCGKTTAAASSPPPTSRRPPTAAFTTTRASATSTATATSTCGSTTSAAATTSSFSSTTAPAASPTRPWRA